MSSEHVRCRHSLKSVGVDLECSAFKCTLASRNTLVARKMRWGIPKTYACIGFRMAGNFGPKAAFDHVNVHNREPEGD